MSSLDRLRYAIEEAHRVLEELTTLPHYERMGTLTDQATDALHAILHARERALLEELERTTNEERTLLEEERTPLERPVPQARRFVVRGSVPPILEDDWRDQFNRAVREHDLNNVKFLLSLPYTDNKKDIIETVFENLVWDDTYGPEWMLTLNDYDDLENMSPYTLSMILAKSVVDDETFYSFANRILNAIDTAEEGLSYALFASDGLPRSPRREQLRARLRSYRIVPKQMPWSREDEEYY